jgi:hypothetical protein
VVTTTIGEVFSECVPVPDGSPLRQGDIFIFRDDVDDLGGLQKFGIVVTGDCDLVNDKHFGIVSYVPVLPLPDYVAGYAVPKLVEDLYQQRLKNLELQVREFERNRTSEPGLSRWAIQTWANRAGGDRELLDHFGVENARTRQSVSTLMAEIQLCAEIREIPDLGGQLEALGALFPASKSRTPAQRVTAEVQSRLTRMPGDAFLITSLGQGYVAGYVAYLRLVRDLRTHQIATSFLTVNSRDVIAERVARLGAPYVYRLTQLLADVFASIGLPEEYERARAAVVAGVGAPGELTEVA